MPRRNRKHKIKIMEAIGSNCSFCDAKVTAENINNFRLKRALGFEHPPFEFGATTYEQAKPHLYKIDIVCDGCLENYKLYMQDNWHSDVDFIYQLSPRRRLAHLNKMRKKKGAS